MDTDITLPQAMDQALRFLWQRFLSCYELRQKMRRKNISNELIDQVEAKMIEYDYLNDQRLADQVLAYMMKEQKYGAFFIKQKMKQRGLEAPSQIQGYDEMAAAFKVVERKFGKDVVCQSMYSDFTNELAEGRIVNESKVISALKNRGFSPAIIRAVCNELKP